ncbi:MAG: PLP-dependent cysteine synthase family protein [Candidatus Pacebacteria bacterium]|nr:PLP-dependent cysteine synthase family protein [Candidatus Paceibacterota bacterium]
MKTILDHIGNTPFIKVEENIFAKVEGFNPGGSIKDRIVLNMINEAEKQGILKEGDTLVEVTSGNTGVGFAMVGAMKGYKVKVIMPESTSKEKIKMIKVFGGEVILVEDVKFRKVVIEDLKERIKQGEKLVFLNQYENQMNPLAHYEKTAEEILGQMEGKIDYFVAGMGTGGTITGIGRKLKEKYPDIKIIGVQPIQGQIIEGLRSLKDGFVPPIIDLDLIDEIYDLEADKAIEARDGLARKGILVGPSSGAALYVSQMIKRENPGKNIVTVFPDRGERYLQ